MRVVQDYNANGKWEDSFVEPGMGGVSVEVVAADGTSQTFVTDTDGTVTFAGAPGTYRISVANPDPTKFNPSFASEKSGAADTPSASRLSPNQEFITVGADETVDVTTGFWEPGEYCQTNPTLVGACQQLLFDPDGNLRDRSGAQTIYTAPYRGTGIDSGVATVALESDTGAVYGIGYRKQDKRIFSGAYAKRGTNYGPGGPGAIYVSTVGGGTTLWGVVPDVGTSPHQLDTDADMGFMPVVSKESLGDVDVSEDGDHLQVVNLKTRQVLVYDASTPTMGDPLHTIDVSANPGCASADDWRPFALGERHGTLYVGGVCSAESTKSRDDLKAIILTFDAENGYAPLGPVMDQPLNFKREPNFTRGCPSDSPSGQMYHPWTDTVPCGYDALLLSQPLMSDIVVETDGSLVLGFRNRFGDQYVDGLPFESTSGDRNIAEAYFNSGDINKACDDGSGMFVIDANGACGVAAVAPGQVTNEYFSGDQPVLNHGEATYGGLALARGERGIATTSIDPYGEWSTQGYLRVDRETGKGLRSASGGVGTDPSESTYDIPTNTDNQPGSAGGNEISAAARYAKGQGLADLEVLCDLAPIQIGNRVWNDVDGDGIQGVDEAPIAGVTVNLYDTAGNVVATTVTNSRGEYYFDSVTDGLQYRTDYVVRLDNPSDYESGGPLREFQLTLPDRGAGDLADELDSDGRLVNGYPEAAVTTGRAGDVNHTIDFGFRPLAPNVSVGDFVWVDSNKNGTQDGGEPGIPGVVLVLTGPDGKPVRDVRGQLVEPVTTDADGKYLFEFLPTLPAGQSYTVTIDPAASATALAPYAPTQPGQGTPGTDSSTGSATSGDLVNGGDIDDTLDFGFVEKPAVSVGNFVWLDVNGNGVQDGGENGIPGVVLVLTGPDGKEVRDTHGNIVGPQTTDANGEYNFVNLPPLEPGESYTVRIDAAASAAVLADLSPTQTGQGTPATDSSTGSATSGDLVNDGDRDDTLDFGFVKTPRVSVGNYVWLDADNNGIQDGGELGIPGVSLILTGPDGKPVRDVHGNLVGPTTTDASGHYSFDDLPTLPAGESYTVTIDVAGSGTALDGLLPTKTGQGTPGTDSSTGSATSGDLTSDGDSDQTLDFGFYRAPGVSVGNLVWADTNGDGIQDLGEPGIGGVVLVLTGPDGNPVLDLDGNTVGPVTTDPSGAYLFANLPPLGPGESYTVTIDEVASAAALAGYEPTLTGQGTPATDSSTGSASSGDLTNPGDHDGTLDFGFIPPAEPPVPSVSVGNFVWLDENMDGIQDAGEPGIPGVVLVLTGPDGKEVRDINGDIVGPQTTDADGEYRFENLPTLPAGQSYTVTIDAAASAAALAGIAPTVPGQGTSATDSSTGSATSGDLVNDGDRDFTLDFGFVRLPSVSVGNFVWLDENKDGIQDVGEPGIPGVVLVLTGPDGKEVRDINGDIVGPQTTDADGEYRFENLPTLPAGQSYTVTIDPVASASALAGVSPTIPGQGTSATDSSTGSATSGDLVNDGDRDFTLDFGFVPTPRVSVGDLVWLDLDGDGVQDPGEPGLAGATLNIVGPYGPVYDVNGNLVGPIVTPASGEYSFDNLPVLPAGESYRVTVTPPPGYAPTLAGQGTPGTDSSTDSALSGDLTQDGDRDDTLDFGFTRLPSVSVGDYVWADKNGNGIQNPGEKGIPGVVLVLTGPDGQPVTDIFGNPVGPTTTGPNGRYRFENLPTLPAGQSYTVTIDATASAAALAGYVPTKTGQGTPGNDSSTGSATSGDLVNDGDRDFTLDFGFIPPKPQTVSVGDLVWFDKNGNGIQNPGEPGIKGVVLVLTGPDGKPVRDVDGKLVRPVVTDKSGRYSFTNLPLLAPGQSYTVSIDKARSAEALAYYQPTLAGRGGRDRDSSTDSARSAGNLTVDGAFDMTLDFGFVLTDEAKAILDGAGAVGGANAGDGTLPKTGLQVNLLWLVLGIALILAGATAMGVGVRRNRQAA